MSVRALLAADVPAIFRGYLQSELAPNSRRFRPGGFDRAVQRTINSLQNLSRRDPTYIRDIIGPAVRDSLRAARRLNAGDWPGTSDIPWYPGQGPGRGQVFRYRLVAEVQQRGVRTPRQIVFSLNATQSLAPNILLQQAREILSNGTAIDESAGGRVSASPRNVVGVRTIEAYRLGTAAAGEP